MKNEYENLEDVHWKNSAKGLEYKKKHLKVGHNYLQEPG